MPSEKRTKKRTKKVQNTSVEDSLTPTESKLLGYYKAGLSTKQIQLRTSYSNSYVNRIRRKLERYGLLSSKKVHMVHNVGHTPEPSEPKRAIVKRLHALRWRLPIRHRGNRFSPVAGQHFEDGCFVQCARDSLIVYAPKGLEFSGSSMEHCFQQAWDYFRRVFSRLETDLDVLVLKDRSVIRLIYAELSTLDPDVATPLIERESTFRVFSESDGKLRFSVDMSTGVPEWEVHHRETWASDDKVFSRQFNALADNPSCPSLPELASVVHQMALCQNKQAEMITRLLSVFTAFSGHSMASGSVQDDLSEVDYFG